MFDLCERLNKDGLNEWGRRSCGDQLRDFIYGIQENLFAQADEMRQSIVVLEELRLHNDVMREKFLQDFGGLLQVEEPLHADIMNRADKGEFILENIIFNSYANTKVTASMYLPKGIQYPAPAVLFLCGHSQNGRMYPQYQIVCQTLARAGMIVFAMDPVGQGERSNYYDKETGEYIIRRGSADHDACGIPAMTTGRYLYSYFICDFMRAIDYLETRPEIDASKIGVTGNSGGGLQTLLAMAVDDRIAAAAPGTFTSNRREVMYTGKAQDAEQIWPGITRYGFDHVTPYMIFAPKPVAIMTALYDFYPIEGTKETFETAKRFYGLYGKEENIRMYEDRYVHSYTPQLAVYAAEFFTEVFLGQKITVDNSDIQPLPESDLFATECGNLGANADFVSIQKNIREYAEKLREKRLALPPEKRRKRAKQWLTEKVMKHRLPAALNVRMYPPKQDKVMGDYNVLSVGWMVQKRLFAMGDLIQRAEYCQQKHLPVILAIWSKGTKAIEEHAAWICEKCDAGYRVMVLDMPGEGMLKPNPLEAWDMYKEAYGTMYCLCDNLIFCDDCIATLQCHSVLRTIEMLKTEHEIEDEDITIYCEGLEGTIGVLTGFLNERVNVELGEGILRSVEKEIVQQEIFSYNNTMGVIIPGMLEYFDYEEIVR